MINPWGANKYEQRQHWRSDRRHRAAGRYYFDESGSHPGNSPYSVTQIDLTDLTASLRCFLAERARFAAFGEAFSPPLMLCRRASISFTTLLGAS
jgi:hypothetical protein